MVPTALPGVDHGVGGAVAHDVRAAAVAGAPVDVRAALVLEPARCARPGQVGGVVLGAEQGEDLVGDRLGGRHPGLDVLGQVVGEHRTRVAELVPVAVVEGDAVAGLGALLHLELQGELAAHPVAEHPAQVLSEEPQPVRCGRVAGAQDGRDLVVGRGGRPAPAPVTDLDPERRAVRPGGSEAEALQSGGGARAAVGADRLRHQAPGEQDRMVHQVAADLVAGVGQAGGEQQPGVLDRVRGQHDDLGVRRVHGVGGAVRVLVALVLHAHGPAAGVHQDAADHGAGEQGDGRRPAGLGPRGGVLRTGRADRDAAGAAGAGRSVRAARLAVAPVRRAHHAKLGRAGRGRILDLPAVQPRGQHPVEVAGGDRGHRERVAVGERQADRVPLFGDIGGDPDLPLGRPVVGLQLRVADGPVAAVAEVLGVEVLRVHARGQPRPGGSGAALDPQVAAGVRQRAALDEVPVGAEPAAGQTREVQHLGRGDQGVAGDGGAGHLRERPLEPRDVGLVPAGGPVLAGPVARADAGLQHQDPASPLPSRLASSDPAMPAPTTITSYRSGRAVSRLTVALLPRSRRGRP